MHVDGIDLPSIGRKFTIQTQAGNQIVIVIHRTGRCQVLCYDIGTRDEPLVAFDLTNEEAREVGAILSGIVAFPEGGGPATSRLAEPTIAWIEIRAGHWVGRTLRELPVPPGVNILAISRDHILLPSPEPETRVELGDALLIAGPNKAIDLFQRQLGR